MVGCMMFVVVYWLLMVCLFDWLLVFDCGKVIEEGNYDVLICIDGGIYCWLFEW